jgi:hypothetical protein
MGCLADRIGPGVLSLEIEGGFVDPAHPLEDAVVRVRVRDASGEPVAGATLTWVATGVGSNVVPAGPTSDWEGYGSARWTLGTDAREEQGLRVLAQSRGAMSEVAVSGRVTPNVVAQLRAVVDTPMSVRLGDTVPNLVEAVDPYGNPFPAPNPELAVDDSAVVWTIGTGVIGGRRGATTVTVRSDGRELRVPVRVVQYVAAIVPAADTLRFSSLGADRPFAYEVMDDRGRLVADTAATVSISDSAVVLVAAGSVRSQSLGATAVHLDIGLVGAVVAVEVRQRVASIELWRDTVEFDALRDTTSLHGSARDSLGFPVSQPTIAFAVSDTQVVRVVSGQTLLAVGVGAARVTARDVETGISAALGVTVRQSVATIELVQRDILFDALGDTLSITATALDRLGSVVSDAALVFSVSDTLVIGLEPGARLRSLREGSAGLVVTDPATGVATSASVMVAQRTATLVLHSDRVDFTAVGDTAGLAVSAWDRLGSPVTDDSIVYQSSDAGVVSVRAGGQLRSQANGAATIVARAASGAADTVRAFVSQVVDSMAVSVSALMPILTLPSGATLPLTCQAFDRNGWSIPVEPTVSSRIGTIVAGPCSQATVRASGIDTLRVEMGGVERAVPVVIAVKPQLMDGPVGTFITLDSFPTGGTAPWAPSARRNSRGEFEVYFAAYSAEPDSTGYTRGNLHRLVWTGGSAFRYDGVALRHNSDICDPQGQGIENVVVLPRDDGPGWRMLYAAGSYRCYGYQVFSAVSEDERTWVKEPGVRLSNGGSASSAPWPVGEGLQALRKPSGEWHLIAAAFEPGAPTPGRWEIAAWTSMDQTTWAYQGIVLGTTQLPADAQAHIYGPAIRQIASGLWRMLFVGDNRGSPGARSRIWSALSTDWSTWQFEGEVLGAEDTNLYYSAVVDDHVVFLRQDSGGPLKLAIATVLMP